MNRRRGIGLGERESGRAGERESGRASGRAGEREKERCSSIALLFSFSTALSLSLALSPAPPLSRSLAPSSSGVENRGYHNFAERDFAVIFLVHDRYRSAFVAVARAVGDEYHCYVFCGLF